MTTLATPPLLTIQDLLAMPEDGVERFLIRGKLWEKPMTRRNRHHSGIEARIAYLIWDWLERQPQPRGRVYSGEAGVILRHDPDSTVGVDVAYVSAEIAAQDPQETSMIDGVPALVVEILSPTDTQEETDEKIAEYLTVGVPLIWIVHPRFRTVQVFRPGTEPELFNVNQELSGEPHMPGFRVRVASIFTR
jgi:Uma2 family endonuclease